MIAQGLIEQRRSSASATIALTLLFFLISSTPISSVSARTDCQPTWGKQRNSAVCAGEPIMSPAVSKSALSCQAFQTPNHTRTFDYIKSNGLDNACYPNSDHIVAEYLFQNPDVCYWDVNESNRTISAVDVPTPPADAVPLPAPSGGNDTAALAAVINANPGRAVVGRGIYKIKNLEIRVSVDIFNMPMEPVSGAREMVFVRSPDVRIFNSPIDGKSSSSLRFGYHVQAGAHRFHLVNSGMKNVFHRHSGMLNGVVLHGVDNFHIACNRFENLINSTSNKSKTARANSIWMAGGDGRTSGGYIVNNTAINHQSNGGKFDSEFLTVQNYRSTDPNNPLKVFGNRAIDAGKRFTKHQNGDALVLSNHHEWATTHGPLGKRRMLSYASVLSSDDVTVRNNRITVAGNSDFDSIFVAFGSRRVQDNIHFDCNDIEIKDTYSLQSSFNPVIVSAAMRNRPDSSTGFEATNSSAKNNVLHGSGSVSFHYWFGAGYQTMGGRFDAQGNQFNVEARKREYR